MRMWSQNLVALVQFFASSNLVLTLDESCSTAVRPDGVKIVADVEELLTRNEMGEISGLSFPDRIIVTANHQGMQFFDFIFLKRKLALDKENIVSNLTRTKKSGNPLWLVLFPEGTGLHLCTLTLDDSVEWLYDFTIGYPGVRTDENPEDVYNISKIFFLGQNPKQIHIHIRRFKVSDIPKDAEEFSQWVHQRWIEKDLLMTQFYKDGRFAGQDYEQTEKMNSARTFEIPIKLKNSVIDLAQPYVFLLSYIPLVKMAKSVLCRFIA
ncbi:hypothetical protein DFQ28_000751 [Apophysomyces sp. BC1034]|nr:hypothetical protein DFQ30_002160 [Apophysomyces sp. BC1015]KAG0182131.1 hypothetical protein DFQ29_005630 [Apophysomyces sp. BC1021]KAG0191204.1 hypothetical protein DFQ28_000751 [Apophysomyces sp. BC1034]